MMILFLLRADNPIRVLAMPPYDGLIEGLKYCEVTIRRWEKLTGSEAILVSTGRSFAETCASREANHAFDLEMGFVEEEESE
ncbi:MAG: hypothetical protein JKY36_04765 [Erythrobacter sp.]|nr:hypothetical protein [Erythrobacter sp.]